MARLNATVDVYIERVRGNRARPVCVDQGGDRSVGQLPDPEFRKSSQRRRTANLFTINGTEAILSRVNHVNSVFSHRGGENCTKGLIFGRKLRSLSLLFLGVVIVMLVSIEEPEGGTTLIEISELNYLSV